MFLFTELILILNMVIKSIGIIIMVYTIRPREAAKPFRILLCYLFFLDKKITVTHTEIELSYNILSL